MTPIWRRKRRGGGAGPCCSWRRTMCRPMRRSAPCASSRRELTVLPFPAWDCLPYDRVSPKPDIESRRLATLAALGARRRRRPAVIVTTINALLQRVPPQGRHRGRQFRRARTAQRWTAKRWSAFLSGNGYVRAGTVREPGDFALRGGIVDLWPPGEEQPLRLDFFGSTLDAIRRFDAETQLVRQDSGRRDRAAARQRGAAECAEPSAASAAGYVAAFGPAGDDPLYESVSAGRKTQGMEHWLPLFYDRLDTLFDYLPRCAGAAGPPGGRGEDRAAGTDRRLLRDPRAVPRIRSDDKHAIKAPPYKPLKPEALYLTDAEWKAALARNIGARSVAVPGAGIDRQRRCRRHARAATSRRSAARRQSQCLPGRGRSSESAAGGGQARAGGQLDRWLGRAHGRRAVRSRR